MVPRRIRNEAVLARQRPAYFASGERHAYRPGKRPSRAPSSRSNLGWSWARWVRR
jgi:hypothetical protein